MKAGTLLLIAPSEGFYKKACLLHADIAIVADESICPDYFRGLDIDLYLVDIATLTAEQLMPKLKQVYYHACLTNVDYGLQLCMELAELLSCFSVSSKNISSLFRNKYEFRKRFAGHSRFDCPHRLVEGVENIQHTLAHMPMPFVLKPTNGTASLGVFVIKTKDELLQAREAIERDLLQGNYRYAKLFPINQYLAEGFIEGKEYSVETLSCKAKHQVIALTEKRTKGQMEVGHIISDTVDQVLLKKVQAYIDTLLYTLNFEYGVTHIELIIDPDDKEVKGIVECHDRIGGDRISDLVQLVYGIDLEMELVKMVVEQMDYQLPNLKLTGQTAVAHFFEQPLSSAQSEHFESWCSDNKLPFYYVEKQASREQVPASWNRGAQVILCEPTMADCQIKISQLEGILYESIEQ